jgi:hypothetical protein
MKKSNTILLGFLLLLFSFSFNSCEKDEFTGTGNLVLKFYNHPLDLSASGLFH